MKVGIEALRPRNALYYGTWGYRNHVLPTWGHIYSTEARLRGISLGKGVRFFGRPILQIAPRSTVTIGAGVDLISNNRRCSTANLYGPCRIETNMPSAAISIGEGTGLNGTSIWCRSTSISIGRGSAFGPNCVIMDSPAHPLWPPETRMHYPGTELDKPVSIGDNVWLGNGVLILPGAVIGDNAVVGARSVVTGTIPPNCLAVGIPARVIKNLAD